VIYAYGICEPAAAAPPPDRRGLGGTTLRALERDGLAAVYSCHRSLRPLPDPRLVLTHERVVEAIMGRGAVLPMRFGMQLEREDALSAVLAERRVEMLRTLDYVRGHVEMGLRVSPAHRSGSDPGTRHGTGRDYLLARVRDHRRTQCALREVHAPLADLAAASRVREHPAPPAALVGAYLVAAGGVEDFRGRARNIAAGREDIHIHVTGPWPPYNFVNGARE
jgi:hypothetical protein